MGKIAVGITGHSGAGKTRGRIAAFVQQRRRPDTAPMRFQHVLPIRDHADLVLDGAGDLRDLAALLRRELRYRSAERIAR